MQEDIVQGKDTGLGRTKREERDSFKVDISRIVLGQDIRTTMMIKNIPNKYTDTKLLESIDVTMKDKYDFIYLPIDYRNNCNMGYAFINFIHPIFVPEFHHSFNNTKWNHFKSEKICEITYGRIQGK